MAEVPDRDDRLSYRMVRIQRITSRQVDGQWWIGRNNIQELVRGSNPVRQIHYLFRSTK
jgi:hypothetical protein